MSVNLTPKTWTAGSPVLASEMNTEVRDVTNGLQAAWDTWVPTLAGFTLGNGTMVAKFIRYGKTVHYRLIFTAGTTSTFTSTFTVTLPAQMHADYSGGTLGAGFLVDASVGSSSRTGATVHPASVGSNTAALVVDRIASNALVTNAVPWTWATGDTLSMSGTYEAA